MSEPQDLNEAIETSIFVDIALPIEERRHQARIVATLKEAARLVVNPNYETVQLCGRVGNYRKGKPLDLTCIYGEGHYDTCGRYLLIPVAALTSLGDIG